MKQTQSLKSIVMIGLLVMLLIGLEWKEMGSYAFIYVPSVIIAAIFIGFPIIYWILKD